MRLLCLVAAIVTLCLAADLPAAPAGETGGVDRAYAFPVGEKLIYRLYWGILPVGRAEFSSQWTNSISGSKVLLLRTVARTTSVVSKIYPVNDVVESYVDPETFLPIRYEAKLREGRHTRNDVVDFDHDKKTARWQDSRDGKTHDIDIDADTRDILSLCYSMRGAGLAVGQLKNFRVLVDDELYDLQIKGQKYEKISVKGFRDSIRCIKVVPRAKFGEIFVRRGHVRLWFSDDERQVCVRMTGRLPVASVMATLVKVEGPGDDSWVKPEKGK